MKEYVHQGDILKVDNIRKKVLVTSKDFFNQHGEIIGCPIYESGDSGPLHIYVECNMISGYVQCEKIKLIDLNARGFAVIDRINMADIVNITDAIQGIFDYV